MSALAQVYPGRVLPQAQAVTDKYKTLQLSNGKFYLVDVLQIIIA